MALTFNNNAISVLAADISAGATTLTVRSGDGALFPVTGTNTFNITVQDSTGNYEIMLCTSRTTDTFTVTRAQESTTARAFSAGATVENRFTAGTMSIYAQTADVQPLDATLTALAGVTVAADKVIYATGADAFSTTTLTSAGRALIDDADAATMRTTLGLGDAATGTIGSTVQGYDANTVKKNVVNAYTKQQSYTNVALSSSSGALAIDCDIHAKASITLTENTTVSAATNQADGKVICLEFVGASTYTLGWNANYKANTITALPSAPAAGKRLTCWFQSDGTYMRLQGTVVEA